MKINLDYKNVYVQNSGLDTIVRWEKQGPVIFSNPKFKKTDNYDINNLIKESNVDDVLDFLDEIKEHYDSKYHHLQIDEVIDYVNNLK